MDECIAGSLVTSPELDVTAFRSLAVNADGLGAQMSKLLNYDTKYLFEIV